MKKTYLFQLTSTLTTQERRNFQKFLASPFWNTRHDLSRLFVLLIQEECKTKEELWSRLNPDSPFSDQQLRLLMSYLVRLLEKFISVTAFMNTSTDYNLWLLKDLRQRGMHDSFRKKRKKIIKELNNQPYRDTHFYDKLFQLQWEQYQTITSDNPTETAPLKQLSQTANLAYLTKRFRIICLETAQRGVYQAEGGNKEEGEIISLAEKVNWPEVPALALYVHCFRMLKNPEDKSHFQSFKSTLLEVSSMFSDEEMRGLYLLAINYCIRRLNDGELQYFKQVLDLYKAGLTKNYLLENGQLSRFTYHNIVAAGLQSEDFEWVKHFIQSYKTKLGKKYRESSYSFNLARLEYSQKQYDAVLDLLQRANYRDPLLNLAAKTLLLKTYYEMDEYDLLQSHLDAMRNYIRRKRVIGYHKTNYLNIVRFTEKLLKIQYSDSTDIQHFRMAVGQSKVLTEREWLLQQVI